MIDETTQKEREEFIQRCMRDGDLYTRFPRAGQHHSYCEILWLDSEKQLKSTRERRAQRATMFRPELPNQAKVPE